MVSPSSLGSNMSGRQARSLGILNSISISSLTSKLRGESKPNGTESDSDSKLPVIELVNPVVCPLAGGTRLTLSGKRFGAHATVHIGGITCNCVSRSEDTLVVISPSFNSSGHKDVVVENDAGAQYVLSEVLFYTDDNLYFGRDQTHGEVNGRNNDGLEEKDSGPNIEQDLNDEELVISFLNPSMCPLNGTQITMTIGSASGKYKLNKGSKVVLKVGGVLAKDVLLVGKEENTISFTAPPMPSGGFQYIALTTDGLAAYMENALNYQDLERQDEKKYQFSKSFPSQGYSNHPSTSHDSYLSEQLDKLGDLESLNNGSKSDKSSFVLQKSNSRKWGKS